MYLCIGESHVARAADVRLQLRLAPFETGQRADRNQLALGVGEVVACEDVAEEMGLKIIIGGRGEGVVERLSGQLRLHRGALLEGVVAFGQRGGVLPLGVVYAAGLALVEHALQRAKCVKAARKAGVGVELRQRLLYLTYGQAGIETAVYGSGQSLHITFGFKA